MQVVITLASHAGNRSSSPRIGTNYFVFPLLLFSLSRVVRYTIAPSPFFLFLEQYDTLLYSRGKNVCVCESFITRILTRIRSIECRSSHWRLAAQQYVRTRSNGKGVRNDHELFSSNRGISHLNEARRIDKLSRGSILGLKFSQTTSDQNIPQLLGKKIVFCQCLVQFQ